MKVIILILMVLLSMAACNKVTEAPEITETKTEEVVVSYKSISAAEAKEIMDTTTGYIILDVRRPDEFASGYIKNAINIPNEVILEEASNILKDKNQVILVYCRSGRRSKEAASKLVQLGYANVLEFGGILDWEYGIIK